MSNDKKKQLSYSLLSAAAVRPPEGKVTGILPLSTQLPNTTAHVTVTVARPPAVPRQFTLTAAITPVVITRAPAPVAASVPAPVPAKKIPVSSTPNTTLFSPKTVSSSNSGPVVGQFDDADEELPQEQHNFTALP